MLISLIATIVNLIILLKELHKRQSDRIIFFSKWTKHTSLLSIVMGTMYTIISMVGHIYPLCQITRPLIGIFVVVQFISLGLNQICRLYYCFSQNKVYSNKGYPTWLFIIMILYGIFLCLAVIIGSWIWLSVCSGSDRYPYISDDSRIDSAHNYQYSLGYNTMVWLYLLWDITTLALYVIKVISLRHFKHEQKQVYNRIMSILKKVVILTVLYQITGAWVMMTGITKFFIESDSNYDQLHVEIIQSLWWLSWMFASVVANSSIFLMQSHNEKEYQQFLKIMHEMKIYYICCGCRETFIQAEESMECEAMAAQDSVKSPRSIADTRDISVKETHSVIRIVSTPSTVDMYS